MHRFEVWAPKPSRVELVVEGRRQPMDRSPEGWWRAEVAGAGPGARYGYSLDAGAPLPDPRSMHQPDGVHELSAVVDHRAYVWHDEPWPGLQLPRAVLYELHVGTFSCAGTFDGVIERLPYLAELGIDAIELLPVASFPGARGWGYDGVDLYAPHEPYGGPDGMKRLVDACHQSGLGCVVDVVYNHLGPSGNHLSSFGPYFTDQHQTPWGDAVNFDGAGSDEVRRFVVDNALMWLRDYHCDGLRVDAVHAIVDPSALHLLEQLTTAVEPLGCQDGRPRCVIAENETNDPRIVRSRDAGGLGLDAAWADDWHHAVHVALTGEADGYYEDFTGVDALLKALRQGWVHDGTWSAYRSRTQGRPPVGLSPRQFVVCTQNHDQVGNRATGDRLSMLVGPGRLEIAAALLLITPFVPMLFAGEEWGASTPFLYFTDHDDPHLGQAVREGRRAEFRAFGWPPDAIADPQDPETFERSKLDWSEPGRPAHRSLLDWYRELIHLRRRLPVVTDPDIQTQVAWEEGQLILRRGHVCVTANLATTDRTVAIGIDDEVLAASHGAGRVGGAMVLPVDTVVVWSRPEPDPIPTEHPHQHGTKRA